MLRGLYDGVLCLFACIETLLSLRFLFKLLGMSEMSSLASPIYAASWPFVQPFLVVLPAPSIKAQWVVEFTTVFALFCYAFIGYMILRLIRFLSTVS